jgi:hypothetical protein
LAITSTSEKRKNIRGRGSPVGGTTNSQPWRKNQRPREGTKGGYSGATPGNRRERRLRKWGHVLFNRGREVSKKVRLED